MPGLLGLLNQNQKKVQFVQNPTGTIISIDCTVSENHSSESPPTEFPLENGESISDHIILKPRSLELQGIISDTPLKVLNSALTTVASAILPASGIIGASLGMALYSALQSSDSPSVAAYGQLLKLQSNKQPFDVITTLQRYKDMWIKSITVPRDANTGQVLVFNISLIQLLLVSPQKVNIQKFSNSDVSANQANLGKQQTEYSDFKQGESDVKAQAATGAQKIGVKL